MFVPFDLILALGYLPFLIWLTFSQPVRNILQLQNTAFGSTLSPREHTIALVTACLLGVLVLFSIVTPFAGTTSLAFLIWSIAFIVTIHLISTLNITKGWARWIATILSFGIVIYIVNNEIRLWNWYSDFTQKDESIKKLAKSILGGEMMERTMFEHHEAQWWFSGIKNRQLKEHAKVLHYISIGILIVHLILFALTRKRRL